MSQKILVIDDSLACAKLAEDLLAEHFNGGDVLVAQRASDAFDRFNIAQPDLILLNDPLPDAEVETVCYRLLNDPATARVPVVIITGEDLTDDIEGRYTNVVRIISKPLTSDALLEVLETSLPRGKRSVNPARDQLFYDASNAVFSGHTHFFSLRAALQMAYGDKLTGVLRFFLNRVPIELFMVKGRFLFATTRNAPLYCRDSPIILSSTNLGALVDAQMNQQHTGCPIFLHLSLRGGFPHDDVVQLTRDHGQRLFSNLWTAGRVHFEFEALESFPDYVKNFPASQEDPDNWVLASLRHVKFEHLQALQRPDPNGSPAYTRKGYESIQKLKLNDIEARFASAVNGTATLQEIAKEVGIPLNDALLIVFRFQTLEIIDYWSSNVLSLQGSKGAPREQPEPETPAEDDESAA
jgi:DNA-binding response OmpR family regulator